MLLAIVIILKSTETLTLRQSVTVMYQVVTSFNCVYMTPAGILMHYQARPSSCICLVTIPGSYISEGSVHINM